MTANPVSSSSHELFAKIRTGIDRPRHTGVLERITALAVETLSEQHRPLAGKLADNRLATRTTKSPRARKRGGDAAYHAFRKAVGGRYMEPAALALAVLADEYWRQDDQWLTSTSPTTGRTDYRLNASLSVEVDEACWRLSQTVGDREVLRLLVEAGYDLHKPVCQDVVIDLYLELEPDRAPAVNALARNLAYANDMWSAVTWPQWLLQRLAQAVRAGELLPNSYVIFDLANSGDLDDQQADVAWTLVVSDDADPQTAVKLARAL